MNRNAIIESAERILDEFNYNTDSIDEVIDASLEAKEGLRQILSKHPNWNEEKGWIAFDVDSARNIDRYNIRDFARWVIQQENKYTDQLSYFITDHIFQFADEATAKVANRIATMMEKKGTFKEGQKISRIVNQLCKWAELDKIKDIRTESFRDDHGILHEREKDYGYNYQFAKYADSINPMKIKRHTIISINPCDYLTMSLGTNWSSCHTIDKDNVRGKSNNYHGRYSGGTLSYALDKVSFVFYYIDADFDGTDYEFEPKQKRCMFFYGEDKLVQARVYPDGRDVGDCGVSQEVRNIVQKVIADCIDEPNLWKLEKGTDACRDAIISRGPQYADYFNYEDCNVSHNMNKPRNEKKIVVGVNEIICPSCGSRHYREECICCEDCYEISTCDECGEPLDMDNYYSTEDGEHRFCCFECAERAGYAMVENDDYLVDEYYTFYDEYDDCRYAEDSYTVYTDYGTFSCNENAEAYGLVLTADADWRREEDCTYVDYDGEYYYRPEDAGFVLTEDTEEWMPSENAVEVDGVYYAEMPNNGDEEAV